MNRQEKIIQRKIHNQFVDGLTDILIENMLNPKFELSLINGAKFLPQTKSSLQFAITHALHIFDSNSIYSFIPKNACSTMRYSLAISNGFLKNEKQVEWIHNNNLTLSVKNITTLLNPHYSFVILRCPYSRLVSVFFDKFIKGKGDAKVFVNKYMKNTKISDVTFEQFINKLSQMNTKDFNQHWRPQVDFLLYKEYDKYFSLENFSEAIKILDQDIGFKVEDTRSLIGHHTHDTRKLTDIEQPETLKIQQLKKLEILPSVKNMYNEEMLEKVSNIYHQDIEFYCSKFGNKGLSFI